MPLVTALTPHPKEPGRLSVEIDRVMVGTIAFEGVARLGLSVGTEVAPEVLHGIEEEGAALRTYDRAVRLLAARGRSIRELRRRLSMAKEPEHHIAAAIDKLQTQGLLDDAEYARQLARSQMVGRGYAPRRLQQELARRGVARDVADRAIDLVRTEDAVPGSYGAESGVDLTEAIEKLARKKLRGLASLDPDTRDRRLYAFLARRGYDSDHIRGVLAKLKTEHETDDSA
jgi:regulatory protein